MIKEYQYNTGVDFGMNPYLDENARAVNKKDGNGSVMVMPFQCEEVPDKSQLLFINDSPDLTDNEISLLKDKNFVVRVIVKPNKLIIGRYAYFEIKENVHILEV